jgi:hypothetical protein
MLLRRNRDPIKERRKFMKRRWASACIVTVVGAAVLGGLPSAQALTMKECSAKYKAAQQAGTLQGMKWSDFRKAECGSNASETPAAAGVSGSSRPPAARKEAPAAIGNTVFPTTVSPKYSNESPGKARMHTCLDQYNADKSNDTLGGLKWIEKGGGYYSECNKRLKG